MLRANQRVNEWKPYFTVGLASSVMVHTSSDAMNRDMPMPSLGSFESMLDILSGIYSMCLPQSQPSSMTFPDFTIPTGKPFMQKQRGDDDGRSVTIN